MSWVPVGLFQALLSLTVRSWAELPLSGPHCPPLRGEAW